MIEPGQALLEYLAEHPERPGEDARVASGSYFIETAQEIMGARDPAAAAREVGYFLCRRCGLLGLGQICKHAEVTLDGGVIRRDRAPGGQPVSQEDRTWILAQDDPAAAARKLGDYLCKYDGILGPGEICAHAEVTSGGGVIYR